MKVVCYLWMFNVQTFTYTVPIEVLEPKLAHKDNNFGIISGAARCDGPWTSVVVKCYNIHLTHQYRLLWPQKHDHTYMTSSNSLSYWRTLLFMSQFPRQHAIFSTSWIQIITLWSMNLFRNTAEQLKRASVPHQGIFWRIPLSNALIIT